MACYTPPMSWLRYLWNRFCTLFGIGSGGGQFLCDSCRYNYGTICSRPEKPNAVRCPDYKKG